MTQQKPQASFCQVLYCELNPDPDVVKLLGFCVTYGLAVGQGQSARMGQQGDQRGVEGWLEGWAQSWAQGTPREGQCCWTLADLPGHLSAACLGRPAIMLPTVTMLEVCSA